MHLLWHWFIEPSPKITESDQRRQAALLTGFLLGIIVLTIVGAFARLFLIDLANDSGYGQAIGAVLFFAVVYAISRTQYMHLAAILAIVAMSGAIFVTAAADPKSVAGGFFTFLILPLWLGSLFIDLRKLPLLIAAVLVGLLVFPLAVPQVTLIQLLVGPFIFISVTSILLLVITHYRNRLEQDRQTELLVKEQTSGRAAARASALLRVADRLNAQLDSEAVFSAIAEEVSHALNTPVALVNVYDPALGHLYAASGVGLPPGVFEALPPFPKAVYDATVKQFGTLFTLPDLQAAARVSFLDAFRKANLRSVAFVAMKYEHELIGTLSAITLGVPRNFTQDDLLLLQGIADQAALAVVNTRLYKDARSRLERLQALRTIDIAIATNRNLQENLQVLMTKITEQLKVDAAAVLLLNETNQCLEFATSLGFRDSTLPFKPLHLGEGIAGRAAQERRIIHIQDLNADPQTAAFMRAIASEGFVSFYAAPLIAQEKVKGVLEIFHRSSLAPDEEWLSFLEALTGQAAIAIESTTLFEDLQHAHDKLSLAYDSTIEGWSRALDLRDKETEGHTQRVTKMTLRLARALGLSEEKLTHMRRGALLHDIGKMGVPDSILLKPSPLNPDEWLIMREHPRLARDMLRPIEYLKPALEIPYAHHEKWDGSGYPLGLRGEEIPLSARIFAVADVYDALISDRPYRRAWSKEKTLQHIRSLTGTHFDPKIVALLLESLREDTPENKE